MTAMELAAKCGVSRQTVWRLRKNGHADDAILAMQFELRGKRRHRVFSRPARQSDMRWVCLYGVRGSLKRLWRSLENGEPIDAALALGLQETILLMRECETVYMQRSTLYNEVKA